MSHEGIRFLNVTEVAAAASAPDKPKLSGEAIQPAKVKVDRSGGTGMEIAWRDGHTSHWTFAWLRLGCPCATCHDEREKDGREPGVARPKAASLLPLYEAPIRPVEVEKIGNYAIKFKWSDGHEAGIYSWDYLRNVADPAATKAASSVRFSLKIPPNP